MIACDVCDDWFHGKCVDITERKAKNLKTYVCPLCETKAKKHKHQETDLQKSRGAKRPEKAKQKILDIHQNTGKKATSSVNGASGIRRGRLFADDVSTIDAEEASDEAEIDVEADYEEQVHILRWLQCCFCKANFSLS